MFADALPSSTRSEVRNALRNYLQFTKAEDWPAMMAWHTNAHALPQGLCEAETLVLSFVATTTGEEIAQRQAARAIARALDARRNRMPLQAATPEQKRIAEPDPRRDRGHGRPDSEVDCPSKRMSDRR